MTPGPDPGPIALVVNGDTRAITGDPDRPLLDVLRHDLGLTAARFGCGAGSCGACHVLAEGRAITACNTPVWSLAGQHIVTLEGLGSAARPHALQTAFIAEQAMQCGYCISGILISAAALLGRNPAPTETDIRTALDGNLCRCGAHNRIVRAIQRAATMMQAEAERG